jgi:protein arginine kinase
VRIDSLINTKAELTDGGLAPEPIVISTRIRLARNLDKGIFPGRSDAGSREVILSQCLDKLSQLDILQSGMGLRLSELEPIECQVLLERRLVSRELLESKVGTGAYISKDQSLSIMINEEDHLRLQCVRSGFNFKKAWAILNAVDSEMEDHLDFAFSHDFGYLTACPTNLGTGLRASAMLHLPGLVMQEYMEKVVRMVNQLGMAVRGNLGEGSEATGSFFQISNQQTLGESEETILKRLISILHAVIEQEENARAVLLENQPEQLLDKIGRAYGILANGHLLSSEEAVNLLSMLRLGVDLGFLPNDLRGQVDRMMMEAQPGHVQCAAGHDIEPAQRDTLRARRIREQFATFPALNLKLPEKPNPESDTNDGTDE